MNRVYKNKRELIQALIQPTDTVLDIGFLGQGVKSGDANWPHNIIKECAQETYGLDLGPIDEKKFDRRRYFKASAENFRLPSSFDVIFAGDLIEHLSNPGLFLDSCAKHLKPNGKLIITTPNCFNLFSIAGKITKDEPSANKDHTCYFNFKTICQLLRKNGWEAISLDYIYTLEALYKESWKKQLLNIFYWLTLLMTPKFMETIVIVAKVK